jgi:hypothetical protein
MAASRSAVAPTCVSAAAKVQANIRGSSRGNGSPETSSTMSKKSTPKGRPKRKRTCVAPTVPRVAISSFCMTLRKTWPSEATTVNTAHNHPMSAILPRPRSVRGY